MIDDLRVSTLAHRLKRLGITARLRRNTTLIRCGARDVRHVDRMGESRPDYGTWADAVLPVLGGREFPTRRVAEWLLYRDLLADGEPDRDRLREASDWLQRKVADNATKRAVLEVLAEVGRAKRVRNTAKSKLR